MAKCSGGLRTFSCFGYFLKMEAFRSEPLTGHEYNSIKFCINKIFAMYQNYPLALMPALAQNNRTPFSQVTISALGYPRYKAHCQPYPLGPLLAGLQ